MKRKNVFTAILMSFLITYTVCEVAEQPNHLFTESYSEVSGFENPSARHADVPLRSRQQKLPVHTTPITDSPSSYDERIGSLGGRILQALKRAFKSKNWNTDVRNDKIRKISTMRQFAARRTARRHKVADSSHGARMPSPSSASENGKDNDAFVLLTTSPSESTGEPLTKKMNTPLKLTILPTEETVIPSVDKADVKSDWIVTQDNTAAKEDEEKSPHNDNDKGNSLPHGEPKVTGHEGPTRHGGTSPIPQHKMPTHPGIKTSSELRWKAPYDHAKVDESNKVKHFKKKTKKSHSKNKDSVDSASPAAIVAGILAAILMLLIVINGAPRLWRIFKKRWRRRHGREFRLNMPSTGYFSEELSEEEVIFDRTAMGRNKKTSKGTSPKSTPNTSPRRPKSAPASYQRTDHATQEQKIWTLTNTPKSTPLIAVPAVDDTPTTEVWTVNEIPESKSLDSSFTTSSLSDLSTWTPAGTPRSASLTSVSLISLTSETDTCGSDLTSSTRALNLPSDTTEEISSSSLPLTIQSKLTIPDSSLSPHPSTSKESSNLSLLPTSSDELTRTLSMATNSSSSSTESCKTPVAPRNEVVITMDDDDDEEIIYVTNEKSQRVVLSTVKDVNKEASREEVVIRIEHGYDEDESLMLSEYDASSGEMIYKSENLEMNNVADDAVIDVISRDDENDGPLMLSKNFKDDEAPLTLPIIPPPTAPTELRQGKSLVGGRKALENRRFIKHLISEQESTGFKRDLGTAISRILGDVKRLQDKSRGKRNVIKHQTQETKYSLAESILRAKSMIMNENIDKDRDKRSSLCRQVIQQTLSNPVRSALRPHRTLAQEIAFAKEIILHGHPHPRAVVKTKVRRQMDRGASTGNTDTQTMYLNDKDYQKWKLIQKDFKTKKAKGIKPGAFLPGVKVVEDFYDFPLPAVDHEKTPQAGCRCYYCEKHNKKSRVRKFFKLPRFRR